MMKVSVISPEKTVLETEGIEVILPTTAGPLGVLTGHLPMVAQLIAGTVVIKKSQGKPETIATLGGFVEVFEDGVYVMTDTTELAQTPDELKIEEAIKRAEAVKNETKTAGELQTASALLAQNLLHIKGLKRRHRSGSRPPV
jgi:F-type H+-transporting ATPase subunit epsilon